MTQVSSSRNGALWGPVLMLLASLMLAGSNIPQSLLPTPTQYGGFGMASTILIGQNWGRKDVEGARLVFGTATGSFLIVSVADSGGRGSLQRRDPVRRHVGRREQLAGRDSLYHVVHDPPAAEEVVATPALELESGTGQRALDKTVDPVELRIEGHDHEGVAEREMVLFAGEEIVRIHCGI